MAGALEQIEILVNNVLESPAYAGKIFSAVGADPAKLGDAAPEDDGVPPAAPQNVRVLPFLKALDVSWDIAAFSDFVVSSVIEYTPAGGVAQFETVQDAAISHTLPELNYVTYTIRVKFIDMWGHESDWSLPATGFPKETAEYLINLEKARLSGNLTNLIPAINANLLAGQDFAANVVKAVSLAQPDNPNQLPLNEIDFENWVSGTNWPPTDSDVNGNAYINASIGSGLFATVVTRNGQNWLGVSRSAANTNTVRVHRWAQRGTFPDQTYILSAFVDGPVGDTVRLQVQGASDSSGSNPTVLATKTEALRGVIGGQRIYVSFTVPAGTPFLSYHIDTVVSPHTTYWTKFQLERSAGKPEPSAWNPGVFTTGVISAKMISALDFTAANAFFKSAAIDGAKIGTLVADKIISGTISAATITLATSGFLKAGTGVTLDGSGLTLGVTNDWAPDIDAIYKISPPSKRAAFSFFQDGTTIGAGISAKGADFYSQGNIELRGYSASGNKYCSVNMGSSDADGSWANMRADSIVFYTTLANGVYTRLAIQNDGDIWIPSTTKLDLDGGFKPSYDSGWLSIGGPGGWIRNTHNKGRLGYSVIGLQGGSAGKYLNKVIPANTGGLWMEQNENQAYLVNEEAATWTCRLIVWG